MSWVGAREVVDPVEWGDGGQVFFRKTLET